MVRGVLYQKICYAGSSWAIERVGNPVAEDCRGVLKLSRDQHNTLKRAGQVMELNVDVLPLNVQNLIKRGDVLAATESAVSTKTFGGLLAYTIEFQDAAEKIGRGRFGDANAGTTASEPLAAESHSPNAPPDPQVDAADEVMDPGENLGFADQLLGLSDPASTASILVQAEHTASASSFVPGPGGLTSVEGNVGSVSGSPYELLGTPSVGLSASGSDKDPTDWTAHTGLRVSGLGGNSNLPLPGHEGGPPSGRIALSPPRGCHRAEEVYAPVPILRPNVHVEGSSASNPLVPDFFDPALSPFRASRTGGGVPLNAPVSQAVGGVPLNVPVYNIGTPFAPMTGGSDTSISPMVPSVPLGGAVDPDESMHSAQDSTGYVAYSAPAVGPLPGLADQRIRQLEAELEESRRQAAVAQQQAQVTRLLHDTEKTRLETESTRQRDQDRAAFEVSLQNEISAANARADERVRAAEDARASAQAAAEYNLSQLTTREKEFQTQVLTTASNTTALERQLAQSRQQCEALNRAHQSLEEQKRAADVAAATSRKLAEDFALQNKKVVGAHEATSAVYASRNQELIDEKTRTAALLGEQQNQTAQINELAEQLRKLQLQSGQQESVLINEQKDQLSRLSVTVAQLQQQAGEQKTASDEALSRLRREQDEGMSQLRRERDEAILASKTTGSVANGYKVEVAKLKAELEAAIPLIGTSHNEGEVVRDTRNSASCDPGGGSSSSLFAGPGQHIVSGQSSDGRLPSGCKSTPGFGAERLNQTSWPRGLTPPGRSTVGTSATGFTKMPSPGQASRSAGTQDPRGFISNSEQRRAATGELSSAAAAYCYDGHDNRGSSSCWSKGLGFEAERPIRGSRDPGHGGGDDNRANPAPWPRGLPPPGFAGKRDHWPSQSKGGLTPGFGPSKEARKGDELTWGFKGERPNFGTLASAPSGSGGSAAATAPTLTHGPGGPARGGDGDDGSDAASLVLFDDPPASTVVPAGGFPGAGNPGPSPDGPASESSASSACGAPGLEPGGITPGSLFSSAVEALAPVISKMFEAQQTSVSQLLDARTASDKRVADEHRAAVTQLLESRNTSDKLLTDALEELKATREKPKDAAFDKAREAVSLLWREHRGKELTSDEKRQCERRVGEVLGGDDEGYAARSGDSDAGSSALGSMMDPTKVMIDAFADRYYATNKEAVQDNAPTATIQRAHRLYNMTESITKLRRFLFTIPDRGDLGNDIHSFSCGSDSDEVTTRDNVAGFAAGDSGGHASDHITTGLYSLTAHEAASGAVGGLSEDAAPQYEYCRRQGVDDDWTAWSRRECVDDDLPANFTQKCSLEYRLLKAAIHSATVLDSGSGLAPGVANVAPEVPSIAWDRENVVGHYQEYFRSLEKRLVYYGLRGWHPHVLDTLKCASEAATEALAVACERTYGEYENLLPFATFELSLAHKCQVDMGSLVAEIMEERYVPLDTRFASARTRGGEWAAKQEKTAKKLLEIGLKKIWPKYNTRTFTAIVLGQGVYDQGWIERYLSECVKAKLAADGKAIPGAKELAQEQRRLLQSTTLESVVRYCTVNAATGTVFGTKTYLRTRETTNRRNFRYADDGDEEFADPFSFRLVGGNGAEDESTLCLDVDTCRAVSEQDDADAWNEELDRSFIAIRDPAKGKALLGKGKGRSKSAGKGKASGKGGKGNGFVSRGGKGLAPGVLTGKQGKGKNSGTTSKGKSVTTSAGPAESPEAVSAASAANRTGAFPMVVRWSEICGCLLHGTPAHTAADILIATMAAAGEGSFDTQNCALCGIRHLGYLVLLAGQEVFICPTYLRSKRKGADMPSGMKCTRRAKPSEPSILVPKVFSIIRSGENALEEWLNLERNGDCKRYLTECSLLEVVLQKAKLGYRNGANKSSVTTGAKAMYALTTGLPYDMWDTSDPGSDYLHLIDAIHNGAFNTHYQALEDGSDNDALGDRMMQQGVASHLSGISLSDASIPLNLQSLLQIVGSSSPDAVQQLCRVLSGNVAATATAVVPTPVAAITDVMSQGSDQDPAETVLRAAGSPPSSPPAPSAAAASSVLIPPTTGGEAQGQSRMTLVNFTTDPGLHIAGGSMKVFSSAIADDACFADSNPGATTATDHGVNNGMGSSPDDPVTNTEGIPFEEGEITLSPIAGNEEGAVIVDQTSRYEFPSFMIEADAEERHRLSDVGMSGVTRSDPVPLEKPTRTGSLLVRVALHVALLYFFCHLGAPIAATLYGSCSLGFEASKAIRTKAVPRGPGARTKRSFLPPTSRVLRQRDAAGLLGQQDRRLYSNWSWGSLDPRVLFNAGGDTLTEKIDLCDLRWDECVERFVTDCVKIARPDKCILTLLVDHDLRFWDGVMHSWWGPSAPRLVAAALRPLETSRAEVSIVFAIQEDIDYGVRYLRGPTFETRVREALLELGCPRVSSSFFVMNADLQGLGSTRVPMSWSCSGAHAAQNYFEGFGKTRVANGIRLSAGVGLLRGLGLASRFCPSGRLRVPIKVAHQMLLSNSGAYYATPAGTTGVGRSGVLVTGRRHVTVRDLRDRKHALIEGVGGFTSLEVFELYGGSSGVERIGNSDLDFQSPDALWKVVRDADDLDVDDIPLSDDDAADAFYLEAERQAHYAHPDTQRQMQETAASLHGQFQRQFPRHPRSCWNHVASVVRRGAAMTSSSPRELVRLFLSGVIRCCLWVSGAIGAPLNPGVAMNFQLPTAYGILHSPDPTEAFLNRVGPGGVGQLAFGVNGSNFQTQPEPLGNRIWGGLYDKEKSALLVTLLLLDTGCLVSRYVSGNSLVSCQYLAANGLPYYAYDGFSEVVYFGSPECGRQAEPCRWAPLDLRFSGWSSDLKSHHPIGPQQGFCFAEARNPGSSRRLKAVRDNDQFFDMSQRGEPISQYDGNSAGDMLCSWSWALAVTWLFCFDSIILGHQDLSRLGLSLCPAGTPGDRLGAYLLSQVALVSNRKLLTSAYVLRAPLRLRNANFWLLAKEKLFGKGSASGKSDKELKERCASLALQPKSMTHRMSIARELVASGVPVAVDPGAAIEPPAASPAAEPQEPSSLPEVVPTLGQVHSATTGQPEMRHFWCSHRSAASSAAGFDDLTSGDGLPSLQQLVTGIRDEVLERGDSSISAGLLHGVLESSDRDDAEVLDTPHEDGASEVFRLLEPEEGLYESSDEEDDECPFGIAVQRRAYLNAGDQEGFDDSISYTKEQRAAAREWAASPADADRRLSDMEGRGLHRAPGWKLVVLLCVFLSSVLEDFVKVVHGTSPGADVFGVGSTVDPLLSEEIRRAVQVVVDTDLQSSTGGVSLDAAKGFLQLLLSSRLCRYTGWVYKTCVRRPRRMFLGLAWAPGTFCALVQTCFGTLRGPNITWKDVCGILRAWAGGGKDTDDLVGRFEGALGASIDLHANMGSTIEHDSGAIYVVGNHSPSVLPENDSNDIMPGLDDSDSDSDAEYCASPLRRKGTGAYAFNSASLDFADSSDESEEAPTGPAIDEHGHLEDACPFEARFNSGNSAEAGGGDTSRKERRRTAGERLRALLLTVPGVSFLVPYVDDLNYGLKGLWSCLFRSSYTLARALQVGMKFSLKKIRVGRALEILGWKLDFVRECRLPDPDKAGAIRAFKWSRVTKSVKILKKFLCQTTYIQEAYLERDEDYLKQYLDKVRFKKMGSDPKAKEAFIRLRIGLCRHVELGSIDVESGRAWRNFSSKESPILRILVDSSQRRASVWGIQFQKGFGHRVVFAYTKKFSKEERSKHSTSSVRMETAGLLFLVRVVLRRIPKIPFVLYSDNTTLTQEQLWSLMSSITTVKSLVSMASEILACLQCREVYVSNLKGHSMVLPDAATRVDGDEGEDLFTVDRLRDLLTKLYGAEKIDPARIEKEIGKLSEEDAKPGVAVLCQGLPSSEGGCLTAFEALKGLFALGQYSRLSGVSKAPLPALTTVDYTVRTGQFHSSPGERFTVDLVFPSTETICVVPCGLVVSKIDLLRGVDFKVTNWASREVSVTPQLFVTELSTNRRVDLHGDLLIAPSSADATTFSAVEDSAILQGADEAAVDAAIAKRLKRAEYKITQEQFAQECADRLFEVLKDWPLALQCCLIKVFMVFRVVLWAEGLPFPTVMVVSAYHPIKPDAKTGGYRRISLEDLLDKILRFHLAEQVYESLLGKCLPIYGLPLHLSALFLAVRKADCLGRLIVDAVQCNKLFPPCSYPLASCEMVYGNLLTTHVAMTLSDYVKRYGREIDSAAAEAVEGALQLYIPAEKNAVGNLKEFLTKRDATFRFYRYTDLPESGKRGDSVLMKATPAGLLPQNGGRFLDMKPTAVRRPRIRAVELLQRMRDGWFKHPPAPCEFRVYKIIEARTDKAFDEAASRPGGIEKLVRKVKTEKEAKRVFLGTPSVPFLCANCVAVDTNPDYVTYSCGSLADPAAVVCPPVVAVPDATSSSSAKKKKAKTSTGKRGAGKPKSGAAPSAGSSTDPPRASADPSVGSSTDPPKVAADSLSGGPSGLPTRGPKLDSDEEGLLLEDDPKDYEEAGDASGDAPGLSGNLDDDHPVLPPPHVAPPAVISRDREEIVIPDVVQEPSPGRVKVGEKKGRKKAALLPLPDPIGFGLEDGLPGAGDPPANAPDEDFRVKPDTLVQLKTQQLQNRAGFTKRAGQLVEYFSANDQATSVSLDSMCLLDDDFAVQPVDSGKYLYALCLDLLYRYFGTDLQFKPSGILVVSSLHKATAELWGLPKFATRICCLGTDPKEGYRFGFTQDFTTVADGLWVLPERVYVVYSREMSSLVDIEPDFLHALRAGQHEELRYVFAAHDARSQGLSEATVQKRVEEALSVRKKPSAAKIREKTTDSKRFVIQGGLVFVFRSVSRSFYIWLPKTVQKEVKLEGTIYRNTTPLRVLCSFAHASRGHAGPAATYEVVCSLGFYHDKGIRLELFGEAGFERVSNTDGGSNSDMLIEETFVTDVQDEALWDEKLDGVVSRMVEQPLPGALVMRVKVCPRKFETKLVRQLYVLRRVYQNSADLERLDGRRYFGGNPLNVILMRPITLCYSAVVAYLYASRLSKVEVARRIHDLEMCGTEFVYELRDAVGRYGSIAAGRLVTIGSHNIDGLHAGFKRGWKLQIANEILQQTACFGQETKIQPHHEKEWREILHCMSGTTEASAKIDFRSCTTRAGNYGSFALLRSGATLPDTPSLEDDDDYNPGLEGRIIVADLGGSVAAVSLYNVNSGKGLSRLGTRLKWDRAVADLMIDLKEKFNYVFVIGDFNALWDHSASSRGSEVTYLDEEGGRIPSLTAEETASLHGMATSSKYTKIAVTHSSDGCPYNFRCGRGHTGDFSLNHLFAVTGQGKTITPPIGDPSLQNFVVKKIPSTETDAFVMGHLMILASQYDHCGLIFQAVLQ
eukprot:g14206.t1